MWRAIAIVLQGLMSLNVVSVSQLKVQLEGKLNLVHFYLTFLDVFISWMFSSLQYNYSTNMAAWAINRLFSKEECNTDLVRWIKHNAKFCVTVQTTWSLNEKLVNESEGDCLCTVQRKCVDVGTLHAVAHFNAFVYLSIKQSASSAAVPN